jgi:hypothetical protein
VEALARVLCLQFLLSSSGIADCEGSGPHKQTEQHASEPKSPAFGEAMRNACAPDYFQR